MRSLSLALLISALRVGAWRSRVELNIENHEVWLPRTRLYSPIVMRLHRLFMSKTFWNGAAQKHDFITRWTSPTRTVRGHYSTDLPTQEHLARRWAAASRTVVK